MLLKLLSKVTLVFVTIAQGPLSIAFSVSSAPASHFLLRHQNCSAKMPSGASGRFRPSLLRPANLDCFSEEKAEVSQAMVHVYLEFKGSSHFVTVHIGLSAYLIVFPSSY